MSTICGAEIETERGLSPFVLPGEKLTHETWEVTNHKNTVQITTDDYCSWHESGASRTCVYLKIAGLNYWEDPHGNVTAGGKGEVNVTGAEICGRQITQGSCPTHPDSETVAVSKIIPFKSG
jgi:hypothetical protein